MDVRLRALRRRAEFRRAAAMAPELAMAWWGVALVNGPHVNFPFVPPAKSAVAWEALQKAKSLAPPASALEQALINALSKRYAQPQPEDRSSLDQAYADAMREVWRQNPRSADIGALFAESVMDLHPWNYWQKDGRPQPWTAEIVTPLEMALRLNPRHPGANHYYIHGVCPAVATERARVPEPAIRSERSGEPKAAAP